MKKIFLVLILIFLTAVFIQAIFYPLTAKAQEEENLPIILEKPSWTGIVPCGRNEGTDVEKTPCTLCHLIIGFQRLVQYGFYIVTTIALVGIFLAGIMYMVSTGDEGMMEQAKKFMKSSLIGFSVVLGAWLIVNVTLWAIAAKTSESVETAESPGSGVLGLQVTGWNEFKCSTQSDAVLK